MDSKSCHLIRHRVSPTVVYLCCRSSLDLWSMTLSMKRLPSVGFLLVLLWCLVCALAHFMYHPVIGTTRARLEGFRSRACVTDGHLLGWSDQFRLVDRFGCLAAELYLDCFGDSINLFWCFVLLWRRRQLRGNLLRSNNRVLQWRQSCRLLLWT